MSARAIGILLGVATDRLLGDPQRHHPVAWFGAVGNGLERTAWRDSRAVGTAYTALLVGVPTAAAWAVDRALRGHPVPRAAFTALATWTVLGGTSLDREVAAVEQHLVAGDLPAARTQVARVVGRDTRFLDEAGVARAGVETVAENTSDAVVCSLVWGALAGPAGLVAHRTANTLDAMVGHRSARHGRFGWASARLDDVLGLPGARVTAALATALAPTEAGSPREAAAVWRRDASGHPSPNAGPVEAAFAGALGVRLGGTLVYGTGDDARTEHRHLLGDGPPPATPDLVRARRLARRVDAGAALLAAATAWGLATARPIRHRTSPRRSPRPGPTPRPRLRRRPRRG
ncbi:CobD/CbiB family cobalamin biosynthesis protein [Nocardioides bruguierae]|uniref:Cobalamin biosynthesis protein CobD n=1 Tax=Nocardioides bruguierae TaxID=2945102 RepID=A0A9X2D8J1_9ACTN|nr:CobD/CbiB family cobalamin biosynthesis protein [Nocardioides bruguierae]MCM0621343.1 cobalamin biosynthesis protein [Nocardioides bruguierae]